jgi:hypothetical protein
MSAPWWSLASQAELTVRVRDLVDWAYEHGCDDVRQCAHLRGRVEELAGWTERRAVEDLAVALRRLEDERGRW